MYVYNAGELDVWKTFIKADFSSKEKNPFHEGPFMFESEPTSRACTSILALAERKKKKKKEATFKSRLTIKASLSVILVFPSFLIPF